MPDTFTETLRAVALNIGVPALIVFWYACRVRHPARPRWQAFLMALAVLATVPAATLAGLHYAITVRDGSPLILIPVGIALPFVLRAFVRAWLRSAPRRRARPRSIRSQPGRRKPRAGWLVSRHLPGQLRAGLPTSNSTSFGLANLSRINQCRLSKTKPGFNSVAVR